jgi:hypothetical protein
VRLESNLASGGHLRCDPGSSCRGRSLRIRSLVHRGAQPGALRPWLCRDVPIPFVHRDILVDRDCRRILDQRGYGRLACVDCWGHCRHLRRNREPRDRADPSRPVGQDLPLPVCCEHPRPEPRGNGELNNDDDSGWLGHWSSAGAGRRSSWPRNKARPTWAAITVAVVEPIYVSCGPNAVGRRDSYLCGREDSNLHGLRHTVLSRAPVPIRLRPQEQIRIYRRNMTR